MLEPLEEMLTLIGALLVAYFVYVLLAKKDDKPSTDSPTMAHAALREIVARAVEESRKLPDLAASGDAGRTQEGRSIAEHSYEDLLATAILNKVIEKFQKEEIDGNSNFLRESHSSRSKCEKEDGFKEEDGSSSLEPLSQEECSSDCSASCLRHAVHQPQALSLTIEERIEEVTTTYTSDDEHRDSDLLALRSAHRVPFPELGMDIIDPSQESSEDSQDEPNTPTAHVDLVSPIESWEENWLFQKKRVHSQPDPVAMLVPNSNTDFKALIGDKDAEDTSDLSECSSAHSDEEIEKELIEAISNVVPRSPKISENESCKFLEPSRIDGTREEVKVKENLLNGKVEYDEGIEEGNETRETCKNSMAQGEKNGSSGDDIKKESQSRQKDESLGKSGPIVEERREVEGSRRSKNVDGETEAKEIKRDAIAGEKLLETVLESNDVINNSIVKDGETSTSAESATSFLAEENIVLEMPKTPASTPTRTSVTEPGFEISNDLISSEKTVLNSLERAKKKLMVADGEIESIRLDGFANDKMDLQAEDVQQESEYTEHYDIATQRHMDSLKTETPHEKDAIGIKSQQDSQMSPKNLETKCREAVALAKSESALYQCHTDQKVDEETQLATPPRPGTIAEREHKKWENAAPIENNPYSEQSIQKRLWERQYSRRASDIPGMHAELPKPTTTELEVVLAPKEPDIARFGRDYYINHSKSASGEKLRRSTASISSRPSSSLSQRSSSTGPDHEHQVSFELERFEEASLRGSLHRWSYRDPQASPNFAVNPLLLHLELGEKSGLTEQTSTEGTFRSNQKIPGSSSAKNFDVTRETLRTLKNERTRDDEAIGMEDGGRRMKDACEKSQEEARIDTLEKTNVAFRRKLISNALSKEASASKMEVWDQFEESEDSEVRDIVPFALNESLEYVAYNPLYEDLLSPGYNPADRDSGMYSMDSSDMDAIKEKGEEQKFSSTLLCPRKGNPEAKENQILSINGRRYWNTGGYKYHTFGGIRNTRIDVSNDESEEEHLDPRPLNDSASLGASEFAGLKFQTFGGIKRGRRIDGRRIPRYRNIKLRTPLLVLKNTKATTKSEAGITFWQSHDGKTEEVIQESEILENDGESDFNPEHDWEDEEDWTYDKTSMSNFKMRERRTSSDSINRSNDSSPQINTQTNTRNRRRNAEKRMCKASRRPQRMSNEDWRNTNNAASDDVIMSKFLKDVSKRPKSRLSTDDDSTYSPTKREKLRSTSSHRRSHIAQGGIDRSMERQNLKLEPPIVPDVVERSFESLKELRVSGGRKSKTKDPPRVKKQGEEIQYKEPESPTDRNIDVKTKVAKWQRNNVEANSYQSTIARRADSPTAAQTNNTDNNEAKYPRKNEVSRGSKKVWDDQRVEELLENERKNSKNEMNAKLNNQESNYDAMLEGRKSYQDENQRKIRRIDLKAYGFENEFSSSNKKATRSSSQRVVNKLDLKSFGYDGGLRRTQSNNHLESIVNEEEFRPSVLRASSKSNLSRCRGYEKVNDMEQRRASSGDNNMIENTKETLCKLQADTVQYSTFGSLTAAKSVPNISKCEYYPISDKVNETNDLFALQNSYEREVNGRTKLENGGPNYLSKPVKYNGTRNGDAGFNGHAVDETEGNSIEGDQVDGAVDLNEEATLKTIKNSEVADNNKLPMPSVRRLAEAFNKPPETVPVPAPRATKASGILKERSSTPEVHIIESPRQMHSLTARSLSKKFREGLRQIPNKVTSPPASHVIMERTKLAENQTEVVQSNGENASNDVNVISPGKLKSNIIFWEQMQKRS
ncbi:hypothetical protein KM043_010400 [Ampulex compressa]|nr:hypothetical protein KM043_010400 [Ampulex compressa]